MMIRSVCILGRQPALGRAELESLFGADALTPISEAACGLNIPVESIPFGRLGGTIKLCKVLTSLNTTRWQDIQDYLVKTMPEHAEFLPEGKMQLGMSVYGLTVNSRQLHATGLTLKKVIRATSRSVRLIPNQAPELNSAQVLHNHLTGPLGWELVIVRDGNNTILAQTVAVQDITAYAKRDQARPKRDARVGMLPPKLAQIIVNLAVGRIEEKEEGRRKKEEELQAKNPSFLVPHSSFRLLDPFCGTGVVLQEALLMGYQSYGTDLEPRMIAYSKSNLDWLEEKSKVKSLKFKVDQGDATSYRWTAFDAIAAETYLGRPFSTLPNPPVLNDVVRDVDTIHRKFLQNLALQTKSGLRLCLAVPAWQAHSSQLTAHSSFRHLPLLDHLDDLGYTRMSFVHANDHELIYHRPGQIVARELIVLIRA